MDGKSKIGGGEEELASLTLESTTGPHIKAKKELRRLKVFDSYILTKHTLSTSNMNMQNNTIITK